MEQEIGRGMDGRDGTHSIITPQKPEEVSPGVAHTDIDGDVDVAALGGGRGDDFPRLGRGEDVAVGGLGAHVVCGGG